MQFEQLHKFYSSIYPFSKEEWEYYKHFLEIQKIKKGEMFLQPGDKHKVVAFVNRGCFRCYYVDKKGNEVAYSFCLDNSFTGEFSSYIKGEPCSIYVQALEDSEVVILPHLENLRDIFMRSRATETITRIITEHWNNEYPEIDSASNKIKILEENGFSPVGYLHYQNEAGLRTTTNQWKNDSNHF